MDAQGGEKLDYMERLYCILAQDAAERGILRDDFYYLSDMVLIRFKLFQGFNVETPFPGSRVHQAYLIWAQAGLKTRRAIAEANGFPMTDQPIPREALAHWIGSELGQITIDPYQVRFSLSGINVLATITVSEPFVYRHADGEDEYDPENGLAQRPIRFHALMRLTLSALAVTPDGDQLLLQFENGETLIFRSEVGGQYESGTISDNAEGGKFWVF